MATKRLYIETADRVSEMDLSALISLIQQEMTHCAFRATRIGFNPTELVFLKKEGLHLDIERATGCEVVESTKLAPYGYDLIG